MLILKRSLLPALLLMMLLVNGIYAADINNPVYCYRILKSSPDSNARDSVLIGKITFDPLPSYQQESRVIIEHYVQFDCDQGLAFKYNRKFDGSLELDNYGKYISDPVKFGDTVNIEFIIKPMKVGYIPVNFIVYENFPLKEALETGKRLMIGGSFKADFLLDPDGKTTGIASAVCSRNNATTLGPSPMHLDKKLVYMSDPRIRQPEFYPALCRRVNERLYKHLFSVETTVDPVPGVPGSYMVDCTVKPFHSFRDGIAIRIEHNDHLLIDKLPASITYPVDSGYSYNFLMPVTISKPGVGQLNISFLTPNPDKGTGIGLFANRSGDLVKKQTLYFGVDDDLKTSFITERNPYVTSERLQKDGSNVFLDPRYQLLESYPFSKVNISEWGEGYRTVMNYR